MESLEKNLKEVNRMLGEAYDIVAKLVGVSDLDKLDKVLEMLVESRKGLEKVVKDTEELVAKGYIAIGRLDGLIATLLRKRKKFRGED